MAIRTKVAIEWLGGAVRWEYDWDDVTLKLKAFRCFNTTDKNAKGTLTSQSTGDTVSRIVGPVQPTEPADLAIWSTAPFSVTIPTSVANRFNLAVDARGRLLGIDHNFEYPV